jgi:hypothetical protein
VEVTRPSFTRDSNFCSHEVAISAPVSTKSNVLRRDAEALTDGEAVFFQFRAVVQAADFDPAVAVSGESVGLKVDDVSRNRPSVLHEQSLCQVHGTGFARS